MNALSDFSGQLKYERQKHISKKFGLERCPRTMTNWAKAAHANMFRTFSDQALLKRWITDYRVWQLASTNSFAKRLELITTASHGSFSHHELHISGMTPGPQITLNTGPQLLLPEIRSVNYHNKIDVEYGNVADTRTSALRQLHLPGTDQTHYCLPVTSEQQTASHQDDGLYLRFNRHRTASNAAPSISATLLRESAADQVEIANEFLGTKPWAVYQVELNFGNPEDPANMVLMEPVEESSNGIYRSKTFTPSGFGQLRDLVALWQLETVPEVAVRKQLLGCRPAFTFGYGRNES